MCSKEEKRVYRAYHQSKPVTVIPVWYTLWFDERNRLIDVRNEHMHSVEPESEVWQHFNNKYNML